VVTRKHANDAVCLHHMQRSIKRLLWKHRPAPPTLTKWIGLRVCQVWSSIGFSMNEILPRAVLLVCADVDEHGAAPAPGAHDAGVRDSDLNDSFTTWFNLRTWHFYFPQHSFWST
jgi:hypothetical protein